VTEFTGRDFGRLEGKLDALLERLPKVLDRHEERIRDIETSRALLMGRLSAISASVSVLVAGSIAWLTKHFA
jgi:hypothetical protein